ncbi:MAG: hypothetical protein R3C68_14740 [Myxococcota bacterium]
MADVPPLLMMRRLNQRIPQQANASPQNPEDGALGFQNAAKPHEEKYAT